MIIEIRLYCNRTMTKWFVMHRFYDENNKRVTARREYETQQEAIAALRKFVGETQKGPST